MFPPSHVKWLLQKVAQEHTAKAERRWFTHEMQTALDAARPEIDVSSVRARLKKPEVRIQLGEEVARLTESLTLWDANHYAF
jgi:DNA helicase-4